MPGSFARFKHLIGAAVVAVAVVLTGAVVTGPARAQDQQRGWGPGWHMWGHGHGWRRGWRHRHMSPQHRFRMQRHWTFMNGNIPVRFQGMRNPLEETSEVIEAGQKLYQTHCQSCHGADGMGEGEAGMDLFPSPALLAVMVQMPIAADAYLMWTISEGGADFNTEMPAFKDTLNDTEMWQIISYLRNGFALP